MDQERLKKANALNDKIKDARDTLDRWQNAMRFPNERAEIVYNTREVGSVQFQLEPSPQAFDVLKAMSVAYWQKKVDDLEKEFHNL